MNETPATSQDSGPLTVAQAADVFEGFMDPEPDPQEATEQEAAPVVEGDEAEPDPEQEETEEAELEEADEEDDPAKSTLHTVKVDGEESQVSIEELVAGYQRHSHYTKQTQAVAEERKAAEQERESLKGERAHLSQLLTEVQKHIQKAEPQIDWDRIRVENPGEFAALWAERQQRQEAIRFTAAEQQRIQQAQTVEQARELQVQIEKGAQALLDAIPEWKDTAKAKAEKAELIRYLTESRGYTQDEVSNATDPRAVISARKAMLYDQLVAKRANLKPVAPAVQPIKTARPGTASSQPSKASGVRGAAQRLAKSGRIGDAAAFFELTL